MIVDYKGRPVLTGQVPKVEEKPKRKPYQKPQVESGKVFTSLYNSISHICPPRNPHCK